MQPMTSTRGSPFLLCSCLLLACFLLAFCLLFLAFACCPAGVGRVCSPLLLTPCSLMCCWLVVCRLVRLCSLFYFWFPKFVATAALILPFLQGVLSSRLNPAEFAMEVFGRRCSKLVLHNRCTTIMIIRKAFHASVQVIVHTVCR